MARKNILLIDDDVWLTDLFTATLRQNGYDVMAARDSLEGMERIDEKTPNLIVLDLFMPGPNGLVLLHELQSHTDLADIPVVLCTNSANGISAKQLEPYGVRRVLDKTTMEPSDIVAAVKACL